MINEKYANVFCIEDIANIENYERAINDKTLTWHCHHRREIDENKSKSQLIAENLYYRRPASELIFLTKSDHKSLHRQGKNNPMFEKRGEKSPRFGKHHSEETRKKMSKSHIGKHFSEETRKKLSMSHSGEKHPAFGTHWWNNGAINKHSKECPGQGWVRGRIKFLRKTK